MTETLREQFLLDPNVIFLNHGSFGACPRPVFETYQQWQREMERQPVEFLGRHAETLMADARSSLAAYVGTAPDNLIFVTNATTGINLVARSLQLQPGDEILATDHEYGAMNFMWEFLAARTDAVYRRHPLSMPVPSAKVFIDSFWNAVTPRTRVIFLSHITSPTALIMPIAEIIRRARQQGILTVIDGAHAPGQLSLQLDALGADFYTGNCHKWLCAPKGAGFLYARPDRQAMLEPLVVSWGWGMSETFVDCLQWDGTRDLAAYLSVPAAIEFQQKHNWHIVRQRCHELAIHAQHQLASITNLPPIAPPEWLGQFVACSLPDIDGMAFKNALYDRFRIEAPVTLQGERQFLRVSFQAYNSTADVAALASAVAALLKDTTLTG